jgi:hypothetical protein
MEKAMNANITTPPTVPPAMRIVFVFELVLDGGVCCADEVDVDVLLLLVVGVVWLAVVMAVMEGRF